MQTYILLLLMQIHSGYPQLAKEDSLKIELNNFRMYPDIYTDSLRQRVLEELMKTYINRNIDTSWHYNTLLIAICQKPELQKRLSYAYQYAGYLHQVKGDYYQSIRYYFKALTTAEKLRQYRHVAAAHRGLAHAYNSLKEYNKASAHCQLGLSVLAREPDAYISLGLLNVLGAIHREQNDMAAARVINMKMYQLAKQEKVKWYEAQGLHAIGWVYQQEGNNKTAMKYYRKALFLAQNIESVDLECSILLHLSDTYIISNNWTMALRYCIDANLIARRIHNSSIVTESEEKLYQIFKSTGRFADALGAHERFVLLRDSLLREKVDHRIESLQAQYDNVKKTNELQAEKVMRMDEQNKNQRLSMLRNGLFFGIFSALLAMVLLFANNRKLHAKNAEINHQRFLVDLARRELSELNKSLESRVIERTEELLSANKELLNKNEQIKEALFKGQTIERKRVALELHDNLSSLLSAVNLSMQSISPHNLSEFEQLVYKNVKQMIQSAYSEVRNISHNILPAGLERDGLVVTLNNLLTTLNQSSGLVFALAVQDLEQRLPIEIEFNLYSIIFELINNTIRHARANRFSITIRKTIVGVELTVIDDGVGLKPENGKRGAGLGNIQTRLESLGGTFTAHSPKDSGTAICIKIPIETVRINGNVNA